MRGADAQYPRIQPPPACDAGREDDIAGLPTSSDVVVFAFGAESGAADHLGPQLAAGVANRLGGATGLRAVDGSRLGVAAPDAGRDAAEGARVLAASHAVIGTVAASGAGLRVVVQLIRTRDGRTVWRHTYDRDAARLLDVEREMAISVAGYLTRRIPRGAISGLIRIPTRSAAAYDYWLQGGHEAALESPQGRARALGAYQLATVEDAAYADAFAALAETYAELLETGWHGTNLTPQQLVADGLRAATRAVTLNPKSAAGWRARGRILAVRSTSDWSAAAAAFNRAIAAEPREVRSRSAYGQALLRLGRIREAEAVLLRAARLDPRQADVLTALAEARYIERRFRPACAASNAAVRRNERLARAYIQRALIRAHISEIRDAWADAETARLLGAGEDGEAAAVVIDALARDTARARTRAERFLRRAKQLPRTPLAVGEVKLPAMALVSAGYPEAAGELLARAYPGGETIDALLRDPAYDGVRGRVPRPPSMPPVKRR